MNGNKTRAQLVEKIEELQAENERLADIVDSVASLVFDDSTEDTAFDDKE